MNIQSIRQQYPQYADMSDVDLATALHRKHYSDIPFEDFSKRIGLQDQSGIDLSQVPGPIDALKKTGSEIMNLPEFLSEKIQSVSPQDRAMLAATGASMLAPQFALPQQAAAALGPPIANAVSKIIPPALGGFLGRTSGELEQNPSDIPGALMSGVQSGAEMATAEGAGQVAVNALGRLGNFAANKVPKAGKELAEFARSKGLPLPPSAVAPTLTKKAIEGGSDAFSPSRLVNDAYRKKAVVRFNQLMTEIPSEVGTLRGNAEVTQDALKHLDNILSGKERQAKQATEEFLGGVGKDTSVRVDTTLQALKKAKESAVDDGVIRFVEKKLEQFGSGSVTAENLETALRQVGKTGAKGDQKFLDTIRKAIKEDFGRAGADVAKLEESNDLFRESFGVLKGQLAKRLKSDISKGIEPTGLTEKLFRNENGDLLSALKKDMPADLWDDLRAQNLANMIYNSSKETTAIMGLRAIDGVKLEKMLKTNDQMLRKVYDSETIKGLYRFASLAKSSASDIAKLEKGIGDFNTAANTSALLGGLYTEPFTAITGTASAVTLAKSMMNPKGIMNRWFTTGLGEPGELGSQALKLGGRAVFSDE